MWHIQLSGNMHGCIVCSSTCKRVDIGSSAFTKWLGFKNAAHIQITRARKVIMSVLWISCRALLASKLVTIQLQDKVTGLAAPFEAVVSRVLGLQLA